MKNKGSINKNSVAWIAVTTLIVVSVIFYSFYSGKRLEESFSSSMDVAMESHLMGFVIMQSVIVTFIAIFGAISCFILFRHTRIRGSDKQVLRDRMENLEREKEFSQTIIDTSKAIIVGLDKDHIIQLFNEGAEKISGYKSVEVLGKDWFEIFFPDEMMDEMDQVWKNAWGRKANSNVNPIRIKDGSERIISWQSSGMYNSENEHDHLLISIGEDITVRTEVEAELRKSRNFNETLLNTIPDIIYIYDILAKKNVYSNNGVMTVLGYTVQEVKEMDETLLTTLMHPDDFKIYLTETVPRYQSIKENEFIEHEYRMKHKSGEWHWLAAKESIYLRCKDGKAKQIFGVIRDITHDLRLEAEKKKLEEQLFQAQKMESIGRLAGGIAHDFNNILTAIMGYAELLSIKFSDVPSSEKNAAGIILQGAVRASDLTKQLLGFARAGKFNPITVDINNLIKEIMNVSEKIFEKKITVSYDLAEHLSVVDADKGQLDQIMTNLIINANDAMPDGGTLAFRTENVTLDESYTCQFPEFKSGNYVKISVTDSGIGMPKEIRKKIFEPFYTTKGEGKGTGLGLATVYGIVKNHEGHINFYSEPGEGTTFNLYFPASDKELVELEQETVNIMGNATVLVVDDEEHVRNLAAGMLEQLGYKTLFAKNGKEAISIYLKNMNLIDLVVLDIIMPKMDGRETYLQLKIINPEVKVVLTSGYAQNGKATEILSQGAAGFVQKPFRINELSKKVAIALA